MEVLPTHCLAPKVRLKIRENDCATRHTKQQKKNLDREPLSSLFLLFIVSGLPPTIALVTLGFFFILWDYVCGVTGKNYVTLTLNRSRRPCGL